MPKKKSQHYRSLAFAHRKLSREWHPTKNGELTPRQVTPGSSRKVWWLCSEGHQWQALVKARVLNGSHCPYCSGRRATPETSLKALHPALSRQWHPTKNGELTPRQVTPGSSKKVWWLCSEGHQWQAVIAYRSYTSGSCPYCSGKRATPQTSLKVLHPRVARQWHPTKNGELTAEQVRPGSNKKVWWKCDAGHQWQVSVSCRISKNTGCPYCAGQRVTPQESLKALHPRVARQWHPTKNGELTAAQVSPGSSKKAWWRCDAGHQWRTSVHSRARKGTGCPYCSGRCATPETSLQALHPDIATQWHPTKNGELTPDQVRPASNKKVWWKCTVDHQWAETVNNRVGRVYGCPYCSGRRVTHKTSLQALHPTVARQWHPTKNGKLTPQQVSPGSDRKVWWKCGEGHDWRASLYERARGGTGCPYCSGHRVTPERSLEATHFDIARMWHPTKNGNLTPRKITAGSETRVWWKCGEGHQWQQSVYARTHSSGLCPYCSGKRVTSQTSLKALYPRVARQWHPTKNGELTPAQVSPGSRKNVWWNCDAGHQWQAVISNRVRADGVCPYCSGKRATSQTSLKALHPRVARQWHPTKNGELTPAHVTPGSGKNVWWKCDSGHQWQQRVHERVSASKSCPYCSGTRVTPQTSLKARHPRVAGQWHPTKNGELTPGHVYPASGKKVWWLCDEGHEWQAYIGHRTVHGSGCPYCAGHRAAAETSIRALHPEVASQWHPTKNGESTPEEMRPASNRKVWWLCDEGHEWQAIVNSRARKGTGCPYCSGRYATPEASLKATHPDIARQWHPANNGELTPQQVLPGSPKEVWWKCARGADHEWQQRVSTRTKGTGQCPFCSGRRVSVTNSLKSLFPKISAQWHSRKNGKSKPSDVLAASKQHVWWRCPVGHVYSMAVGDRTIKGRGCPACAGL